MTKASGLAWAPQMPDHWEVVPLNYVAKMGTGHTPDRSKPEYWQNCSIPWVTTPDVTRRSGSLAPLMDTEQYISELGMKNSAAVLHPIDTVMLSRTASVGYSVRIGRPMATTQAFVTWSPGPKLDARYLLLVLRAMRPEWQRLAYGSTHLTIYMPDLESVRIPLPPLEEQRRIADFLDAATTRIETVQQATAKQAILLAEQLSETARIATTVGSSEPQATGIQWMPHVGNGWQLFKIGHVFSTGSGTTPTSDRPEYFDGPYPWVNSADLNDGNVYGSQKSVTRRALQDFSALKLHPPGSLVVAMYGQGATKGKVGILRIPACLNQACCALVPNGYVDSEYAAYWFRAHKDGIVALAYGAGQPNLSQELIRQLRIPAPDLSEQRSIVDRLRAAEDEVQKELRLLQRREGLLAERRQALITAAVTGQIDVSTASGRGVED